MGQQEVIKILEKENKPLSIGELCGILNEENHCKISKIISILLKYNEIKSKEICKEIAIKKYNCKRRMRVYYV